MVLFVVTCRALFHHRDETVAVTARRLGSVPEPLTEAWIEAMAEVAAGRTVADGVSLVLEYRVAGGPTWHLAVADGTIRVVSGAADAPDVSFHAEWATALAIADGSLDPLRAVIAGGLLLNGAPRSLVMARDLLDDVGDLFSNC